MRYRLRTLLILLALGPPLIAVQYRRWHDDRLWNSVQAAKQHRDELLVAWRKTYELATSGQASAAQEEAIRQRYFSARQDVAQAVAALRSRYGNSDDRLRQALDARQKENK